MFDAGADSERGPAILARNICFSFGSGAERRMVLKQVDFEVHHGEIVLLAGPSGCGKTTLLTLIGALRSSQEGSLRVLGEDLHACGPQELVAMRKRIGFIFQAHNLLPFLTARQNVQMALQLHDGTTREETTRAAGEILDSVGLADRTDAYPTQLSGGQRQRVSIARALAARPQLVLADEPTSALDRQTGREIVDILRRLAKERKTAVVIVTHDNRIFDVADRIVDMDDGRAVVRSALA